MLRDEATQSTDTKHRNEWQSLSCSSRIRREFTPMTKRRAQAFIFWLLPILVLRALMPIGSMLEFSNGTPTVVMCSESLGQVTTQSADTDTTHQVTQHGDQHSVCPFAISLAAAPPVESTFTADSLFSAVTLQFFVTDHHAASGPYRIILTRGPPSLS